MTRDEIEGRCKRIVRLTDKISKEVNELEKVGIEVDVDKYGVRWKFSGFVSPEDVIVETGT